MRGGGLRELTEQELVKKMNDAKDELFRLRFQVALGQNDGVKKLRQLRKEIAQIKTVERERALGINGELNQVAPATEKKARKGKGARK